MKKLLRKPLKKLCKSAKDFRDETRIQKIFRFCNFSENLFADFLYLFQSVVKVTQEFIIHLSFHLLAHEFNRYSIAKNLKICVLVIIFFSCFSSMSLAILSGGLTPHSRRAFIRNTARESRVSLSLAKFQFFRLLFLVCLILVAILRMLRNI